MQSEPETILNSVPAPPDNVFKSQNRIFFFSHSLETAVFISSVSVSLNGARFSVILLIDVDGDGCVNP